jgi:GNAT superfamily N-acetyltransferase
MTAQTSSARGAAEGGAQALSARRAAPLFSEAGRLPDGTPVRVRPLVAGDRGPLLAGFAALSPRSRRSRFLRDVSDAQFERMLPVLFDTVDQQSHLALLLYANDRPVGVGRLRRYASNPAVADLAVTVADDWQGRGVGSVLARELLARADSVREIQTVASRDNAASLLMLARLGEMRSDCVNGMCDVVIRVHRSSAAGSRTLLERPLIARPIVSSVESTAPDGVLIGRHDQRGR